MFASRRLASPVALLRRPFYCFVMASDVERRLLTMYVAGEYLAKTPADTAVLDLGEPFDAIDGDWRVVSHTLTPRGDGSALLSVLVERML